MDTWWLSLGCVCRAMGDRKGREQVTGRGGGYREREIRPQSEQHATTTELENRVSSFPYTTTPINKKTKRQITTGKSVVSELRLFKIIPLLSISYLW